MRLAVQRNLGSDRQRNLRATTGEQTNSLRQLFDFHGLGTGSAEPEMLQPVNSNLSGGFAGLQIEGEDTALAQVMQRLAAFRICAMAHHQGLPFLRS